MSLISYLRPFQTAARRPLKTHKTKRCIHSVRWKLFCQCICIGRSFSGASNANERQGKRLASLSPTGKHLRPGEIPVWEKKTWAVTDSSPLLAKIQKKKIELSPIPLLCWHKFSSPWLEWGRLSPPQLNTEVAPKHFLQSNSKPLTNSIYSWPPRGTLTQKDARRSPKQLKSGDGCDISERHRLAPLTGGGGDLAGQTELHQRDVWVPNY